MTINAENLLNVFRGPAPRGFRHLGASNPHEDPKYLCVGNKYDGTNFAYLGRLILEASTILHSGHPPVERSFSFTDDNIAEMKTIFDVIEAALHAVDPEPQALESIRALPNHLASLALHYSQIISAWDRVIKEKSELIKPHQAGNRSSIANLTDDEVLDRCPAEAKQSYRDGTTDIPAKQEGVVNLIRRQMAEAVRGKAKRELFGTSKIVQEHQNAIEAARFEVEETQKIRADINELATQIADAYQPARPAPVLAEKSEAAARTAQIFTLIPGRRPTQRPGPSS